MADREHQIPNQVRLCQYLDTHSTIDDDAMSFRALLFRRPVEPQAIEIVFNDASYRIDVRRHRQARRYTLRVQAATREVVLTMPVRGNLRDAKAFASKHGGWIASRLDRLPATAPFVHDATLPIRGEKHRIVSRRGQRGTAWLSDDNGEKLLCVAGEPAHINRRVTDFLRHEARRELVAASYAAADILGVKIRRVTVRDQVSRWGSCSSTGVLSYSWRLIMAPPFVLNYLAIHEVAHLVEMNHSRRFWNLVNRLCPEAARAKAWLDLNGADLHRYGASGR